LKDISQEEFETIFLKNFFKRLIDSYITEDDHLEKIIREQGIVKRTLDYEKQLHAVSQQLSVLFVKKFQNKNEINTMVNNSYKMKNWIINTMKEFGTNS